MACSFMKNIVAWDSLCVSHPLATADLQGQVLTASAMKRPEAHCAADMTREVQKHSTCTRCITDP